jgi:two-component system, cell cycle sensor histidine kinase and response regulator CckA
MLCRSGVDACRDLKAIQPDLKLIFMSGYAGDYLSGNLGLEKDVPFISKQVSPKELFEKIRSVLSDGTA